MEEFGDGLVSAGGEKTGGGNHRGAVTMSREAVSSVVPVFKQKKEKKKEFVRLRCERESERIRCA